MVPRSFMWSPEWFVSHGPTPAVWPKGGMLSSAGGPCLSPSTKLRINSASGSAFPKFASVLSHEAGRGVNGFRAFCRKKRASPAGTKPGNTEHHIDTNWGHQCHGLFSRYFFLETPRWGESLRMGQRCVPTSHTTLPLLASEINP